MPLNPLDEFSPPRYRSAGRRPEANNDRTASANAPLSALRGYAAGTAGLPGDIEGLLRSGLSQLPPQLLTAFPALRAFGIGSRADPTPQLPTTDFYNEYLPGANLNQTPTGKAFTSAGNLLGGTGSTTLARYGIKSTAGLADLAAKIAAESPRSGSRAAQLGVIKLPGGNQLKGSFENSLKELKTDVPVFDFSEGRNMKQTEGNFIEQNFPGISQEYSDAFRAFGMHSMDYAKNYIPWLKINHPEIIDSLLTGKTKDQALNNWIDKQLTSYMKNDMATPGDPIRALAERGITYTEMAPLNTYLSDVLGRRRESVGFPAKGFGQSEAAQRWEAAADEAIHNAPARERLNTTISASEKNLLENPWLAKVPPETMTYGAYANSGQQLGFSHLIDELRNATDLASGLPSNLRLKSSSLPQLSVPQAVERVSQINAWRAAEAIKAEKAGMMGNLSANSRLEDPTTQLSFVDKPGMKWVDIPETTDKIGLNLCTTIGKQGGWCTQGEGLAKSYGSGPNRLTTLIDADGRPHAQATIKSGFNTEDAMEAVNDMRGMMSAAEQRKFDKYIGSDEFATYGEFDHEEVLGWLQSNMPKSYKRYLASVSGPPNITEMKPVENSFSSARSLEYKSRDPQYQNKITNSTLKFLNSDEWGSVTDLDYFNIVDLRNPSKIEETLKGVLNYESPKNRVKKFNEALELNPEANRFMTFDEFKKFVGSDYAHYAAGGSVSVYDPDKIDEIMNNLDEPQGYAKGGAVHFDEGGAAFGVFPQMKARRAQQDRTAAANAPLSALRGWAAGTAGLPGDIEGLARAGISQLPPQLLTAFPALRAFGIGSRADPTPQLPTTEFYNEYLPGAQLNATPTGKAFTTAGNLLGGAGSTTLARYGIKSAKAVGQALGPTAVRIGEEYLQRQGLMPGVIKPKGGNFLSGSVEESVSPLKRRVTPSIAFSQEEADDLIARGFVRDKSGGEGYYLPPDPVNNFIDKKIAPYIRNEMATPDDPLRAMAEKYAVDKPVKLAEVQARIDAFAAKMEQEARDRGVPVEMLTSMRQQMIGLEKEKALLEAREGLHSELFPPNADDIQNLGDVRYAQGFEPGGMGQSEQARIWEDLADVAFDEPAQAGQFGGSRWGEITLQTDPWLRKVPPETPVYGEFLSTNNLGFRHLVDELRNATNPASGLPKNLLIDPADLGKLTMPQAVDRVADINAWRATQKIEANQLLANNAATQVVKEYPEQGLKWVELKTPKDAVSTDDGFGNMSTPGYDELEAALKYEGDTLQHCVGGYCQDVVEGKSRIYSLRDSKGQPRVTIEVEPDDLPKKFSDLWDVAMKHVSEESPGWEHLSEYGDPYTALKEHYGSYVEDPRYVIEGILEYFPEALDATLADINNLSPKINQIKGFRNKKPADEYLPFVQDFVKSGKWSRVDDLQNTGLVDLQQFPKRMEALGGRYVLESDLNNYLESMPGERFQPPEGMAQGGLVSNHFDPIKIKQIIAGLDDEYDPENIQQIIAQRESAYA